MRGKGVRSGLETAAVRGLGQWLRLHRLAAGRTLQQIADACGCTKADLGQVEWCQPPLPEGRGLLGNRQA